MCKLPKTISPCPIVEAILEIRFSSSFPDDAVFGIIYNQLKDDFPRFDPLPILQLPAAIRSQDPNMKYSPHYTSRNDNYVLQIGPRSFSINNVENYVGWEVFSLKIFELIEKFEKSGIISQIERLGLRYINILENINVFENSNFSMTLKNEPLTNKTNISTQIAYEKGFCEVKVTSNAEIKLGGGHGKLINGSVIDIDAIVAPDSFDDIKENIEYAHTIEKDLFYKILTEDFIKTLNPEY